MSGPRLKAPFPWFGGKSRVAAQIWERLGDVPNYVEPFAGSLACLLLRPHSPVTETVNDLDCYLANFWRAVQMAPEETARWADWPVNEADLHARHLWLIQQESFREKLRGDPDYFDAKIAGWWVWGLSAWIGSGWCAVSRNPSSQIPALSCGRGVHRKSLCAGDGGRGRGVHAYFRELQQRLCHVRVACGDWKRVLGPSVTVRHGVTGILLDPPYGEGKVNYSAGGNSSSTVAREAAAWAIEQGENPRLRIAVCGYEGCYEFPPDWECLAWKAAGGYGSQGSGSAWHNSRRERIWFSPHCLKMARSHDLFFGRKETAQ
jgi:hypothetical protein